MGNQDASGRNDGWHLDKKVPISIIFAMIGQLVLAAFYIASIDGRIARLEETHVVATSTQRDRDEQQDRISQESFALIRQQLQNMDGKLDRLIERPKN